MSLTGSFSFETDQTSLARALVHPEKPVRDATIQNIAQYLGNITTASELNMLKLWKALYYCLWLTDKEAMQREVASVMSQLLHTLPNLDMQLLYMRTFFVTVLREWLNCDQHRINKLYVLLRLFLREILVLIVDTCNYDTAVVEAVMQTLAAEVFCKTPNGVRFHLTDIFVEELAGVSRGKVNSTRFVALVQPFLSAMACHQDSAFHDRITKRVFLAFLHERSNEARVANKQRARSASVASAADNDVEEEPQVEELSFGNDHIWLRKVSTRLLQAVIFELASAASTDESPGGGVPDHCRKRLYALHKEFAKVTGCSFLSVADALGGGAVAAEEGRERDKAPNKKAQKAPKDATAAATAVVEKPEKAGKKRTIATAEKVNEVHTPAPAVVEAAAPKNKKAKKARSEAEATPTAAPVSATEVAAPKSGKKAAKEVPIAPASSEQAKIKAVLSSMDGAKAAPSAAAATAAGSKAAPSLPPPRNVQGVLIETVSMPKNAGKPGAAALLAATNGKRVKMHYTGKLKSNGKVFDSSVPRGKPFQFRLGAGEVIRGWDIGVKDMLVGERRILTIPPEKGYGRGGAPPQIPGNASLVFDITCMGVN